MPFTLDTVIALTSLENAKQQNQIPPAEPGQDDILTRFINEASQALENRTSRKLKERTYTEYHDGRNNNRLITLQWPVNSIAELWVDSSGEFTDVTKKLDPTDYYIDQQKEGIVLRGACGGFFSKGIRNIQVIYDAGYDPVPADLEGACLWMVEFLYDMRSDERVGHQSKSKNSENVTFNQDVPQFVLDTIERYSRFEFPLATMGVLNL